MSRRVTLNDVARAAGVGVATVSRAMNGLPRCSEETRKRIKELAEKMGYIPDPALSALVAHRDSWEHRANYNLAVVSEGTEGDRYRNSIFRNVFKAARKYGYAIEFHDPHNIESPKALARGMEARGVRGIIWGWLRGIKYLEEFPWEKFAHIGLVLPVVRPSINLVRDDSFTTVLHSVEAAFKVGFQRPGLALATSEDSENDRYQIAGWLLAHHEAGKNPLPVWRTTEGVNINNWMKVNQPDIVIGNVSGIYWILKEAGIKLPSECTYLNLLYAEDPFPGFDCSEARLGESVVTILDGYVRRNILGLVDVPREILIQRQFMDWEKLKSLFAANTARPPKIRKAKTLLPSTRTTTGPPVS